MQRRYIEHHVSEKVKLWMWKAAQNEWVAVSSGYSETAQMPVARWFIVEGMSRSSAPRDVVVTGSVHGSGGG
jgi:hypothetical protein